jgi:hypothetical protein
MNEMVFACLAADNKDLLMAQLLGESIRTFAGDFSESPIWVLVPKTSNDLTTHFAPKFDISIFPFEIDVQPFDFPFAAKVVASAAAEVRAINRASQLVWMDTGSMVINPPHELLLKEDVKLGCRPVDHLLIGSPFEAPIDDFWADVYLSCGVDLEHIFPMRTSADQIKIRPYINAGMLVVRPEHQLLRFWRDKFLEIYPDRRFLAYYRQDYLYQIFIHQAVLAGCILSHLQQDEIVELPHQVNYPLHMHTQFPANLRPQSINELVSIRYEDFFSHPAWQDQIQVDGPLKEWLEDRIASLTSD